ncbi:MAG TPA: pseudouridine synthase [Candidatus Polarisedimenticolia bacterium]|nr:pseudouridine synthase [Candidatus Polarisedimenticolia bacterium]
MKKNEAGESPAGERLQKLIAQAGLASRREAEGWILQGRVSVNGRRVTELGTRALLGRDTVRVDGRKLPHSERPTAILINKPKGYLSTCSDPEKRPTVLDLIPQVRQRLYPVGRLDFNSEGLLILTNDGELALAVTHPRNQCAKVYRVKVRGVPPDEALGRLRRGIPLEGRKTSPAAVTKVRTEKNAWIEVTLREGRKNEIRRMFKQIGHPVLKLKRISIGGIGDRGLAPGSWRHLTQEEIRSLKSGAR